MVHTEGISDSKKIQNADDACLTGPLKKLHIFENRVIDFFLPKNLPKVKTKFHKQGRKRKNENLFFFFPAQAGKLCPGSKNSERHTQDELRNC